MAEINRCEFITSLKLAGKVYVRGTVLYPPLPLEVVSEIERGTSHIKVYYKEDLVPTKTDEDTTSNKTEPIKKIRKKKT